MKYDELAFVNLQLAGMLRSGIPLEGALLGTRTMRRGQLQGQLELLEADLKNGVPMHKALEARQFPDLYRRMIIVGVQGNDLPAVLTLLADHYQRLNAIGTRLKGLMVYPLIVLLGSLVLSVFLALFFRAFAADLPHILSDADPDLIAGPGVMALIWLPVVVLAVLVGVGLVTLLVPAFRRWLRWHMPGFKEAALAQLASAMRLMLKAGTNLADALGLIRCLESNTPAGPDVAQWERRLAEGHARFPELATGNRTIPPLFAWLVSSGGENLAEGFERAAQIYQARATYRIEMLLYAALPVSILCVGLMVISQAYPVIRLFVEFGSMLDRLGQ